MEPDIGQKLRFLPTLPPLDAIGGGGSRQNIAHSVWYGKTTTMLLTTRDAA